MTQVSIRKVVKACKGGMQAVKGIAHDSAMVFQIFALYPHMSVNDTIVFGLTLRTCAKDQIKCRVMNAVRILDIEPLLERKPKALSGGQRQRVAMGRAIGRDPKLFLFDDLAAATLSVGVLKRRPV